MNWKKLVTFITLLNISSWIFLEIWWRRYSGTEIAIGSAILAVHQSLGYFLSIVLSRVEESKKEKEVKVIQPQDCPGHDWQEDHEKYSYNTKRFKCVICGAEKNIKVD